MKFMMQHFASHSNKHDYMEGVGNVHFEAGFETGREEIVDATSQSMSLPIAD